MLAISTESGTGLINSSDLKHQAITIPISSSLQCISNAWAPDNSQLYLAFSSCIKRYTVSEGLLEEIYFGPHPVTCLILSDKGDTVFFASANKQKTPITILAHSSDSSILAAATDCAVLVHNLALSSHALLKGLPGGKISCCVFHHHSRTKLLLGIERRVFIYDTSKLSGPTKVVDLRGHSGHIVAVASSPFSKTLIAVATSNGDVALIDLDKDRGILKMVNLKRALTALSFNAEGAAIYLGTEKGTLLTLDLRALEKEPIAIVVGDGDSPVRAINVQKKSKNTTVKSRHSTASTTPISGLPSCPARTRSPAKPLPGTSPARSRRQEGTISMGVRSPVRAPVSSRPRRSVIAPKEGSSSKLLSPARSPLKENGNLDTGKRGNFAAALTAQSQDINGTVDLANDDGLPSSSPAEYALTKQSALQEGTRPPESISVHLALMRACSSSNTDARKKETRVSSTERRVISESVRPTCLANATSATTSRRGSSTKLASQVHAVQGPVADVDPRIEDGIVRAGDPSSSDLPRQPTTPICPEKNMKGGIGPQAQIGTPELNAWVKGNKGKDKEVRRARFLRHPGESDEDSGGDAGPTHAIGSKECKEELTLQLSPRRPTTAPSWMPSPQTQSAGNLNMNTAAQDFLRNIVRDVMYEFQRETKAEMTGIHLDLVRMGRVWRRELREAMEEWGEEVRQLHEENKRLREENESLRRRL